MNKGRTTKISSQKDLEKEFSNISRLFDGKETEKNWEGRDAAVRQLRDILNSDIAEKYKEDIVKGIHNVMSDLIKSINSLRTSVALEGLLLVSDISQRIGDTLDQYTMEIILSNLLKCSSVTKKLIHTKAAEVTHIFLSNTNFYSKMISMLCKTTNEKNVQLRQLACTYIKTILATHGSKEYVRSTLEKSEVLLLIDQFLKNGLVNAAPAVRDACRDMYWTYYQFWSKEAQILCQSMDTTTQRQLDKCKSKATSTSSAITNKNKNNNRIASRPIPLSRSNSMSSVHSNTTNTDTTTTKTRNTSPSPSPSTSTSHSTIASSFKKSALAKSSSAHSVSPKNSRTIPAISAEVKRNLVSQKFSRLSHISNASAPSTNISHKLTTMTAVAESSVRRTQSEFHHQSVIASSSLLHMLKSRDTQMQCKGIRQLSEKLISTPYLNLSFAILPPGVPSKIDLLPLLMDFITRHDLDIEVYQTLMSWESLAGIFVYVMSVNYYCPTLIIADQQKHQATKKEKEVMAIYSKGLMRVKMFLRRNDLLLAKRLLDLMESVLGDHRQLDASVKRDIQLFPKYKSSLQCGILSWMDEILCDYIGLPEDEDGEILMEGSKWLNVTDDTNSAGQWFDINSHVQMYISFVFRLLPSQCNDKNDDMYQILCKMAGHLKMANQRVFEKEINELAPEALAYVDKALGVHSMTQFEENESEFSLGFAEDINNSTIPLDEICTVDLEEEDSIMFDDATLVTSNDLIRSPEKDTGMTQYISQMQIVDQPISKPQKIQTVITETKETKTHVVEVVEVVDSTPLEDSSIISTEPINFDSPQSPQSPQPLQSPQSLQLLQPPQSPQSPQPQPLQLPQSPQPPQMKKLARPPPTPPRRISDMEEQDESKNKRRKRSEDDDCHTDLYDIGLLRAFILHPETHDKTVFQRIHQLSTETKNRDNIKFWTQNMNNSVLIFSLLNAIIQFISKETNLNSKLSLKAIISIKKLLVNQASVFKQIDIKVEKEYYTIVHTLAKLLLISDNDIYGEFFTQAKQAAGLLFDTFTPEIMLAMLWDLSNDNEIQQFESIDVAKPGLKKGVNPLGNCFIHISNVILKAPKSALEQWLKNGAASFIGKELNRGDVPVRKHCMLIVFALSQVLGEIKVRTFFPKLRLEHASLLKNHGSR